MTKTVPRVLIAGTGSGCGKTTVTLALLRALTDRGDRPAACKCGPDYIDPMFHSRITGGRCANLDPFFFSENTLRALLAENAAGRGLTVVEGVMGYYDGLGMTDSAGTYAVARATETPAVLVVNAKGSALSALAVLEGFKNFRPDSGVRGVIFNGCSPMLYLKLAEAVRSRFGGEITPLGCLPPMPDCGLESRHLGLITAAEVADLDGKLARLGAQAAETVDLEGLTALGRTAPPAEYEPEPLSPFAEPVRIAVARDKAFCFYYEDSLDVLRSLGAELAEFSPLEEHKLPEDIHGLYLGGGYPELYTKQLSENRAMRDSVRAAVAGGLPCVAECGGFMYLTETVGGDPMAGALPGRCFDAGRLTRFGYIRLTAKRDNLLCAAGEAIPAHEFHRWDCDAPGSDFTAEKPAGRRWDCAVASDTLYAGYPHFHFRANPAFARNFYKACLKEKHRHAEV